MKTLYRLAALLALCASLSLTAAAAEPGGWIVRVVPGPELTDSGSGLRALYAPEGLYAADDLDGVRALEESGRLLAAEPDQLVELDELPQSGEGAAPWYLAVLHNEYCRERGIAGAGVRVGLVDSGVMRAHGQLADAAIDVGENYTVDEFIEQDGETIRNPERSDPADDYGHGTFTAGLIHTVAPEAELVPLKAFSSKYGNLSDVVAAVYGGVEHGCDVLNLSLGLQNSSAELAEAVHYAHGRGVVLAAAVGNCKRHSDGGDAFFYPAGYSEVIGVGSVGQTIILSDFSSRNESVFLVAPGEALPGPSIMSADAVRTDSGTSFSAPLISAAAALALSCDETLTPDELAALMACTARDLGFEGYDIYFGWGLADLDMLAAAASRDVEALESQLASRYADRALVFFDVYTNEEGAVLPSEEGAGARRLYVVDSDGFRPVCAPIALRVG